MHTSERQFRTSGLESGDSDPQRSQNSESWGLCDSSLGYSPFRAQGSTQFTRQALRAGKVEAGGHCFPPSPCVSVEESSSLAWRRPGSRSGLFSWSDLFFI